jgi:histidine triad (HIT) family protein
MPECIFCKIVAGAIPSHKVYEDEKVLAFLDIAPVHPGHTLVITKSHFANFEEINEEDLANLIKAVKRIGKAMKDGLGVEGYNMQVNNDPVAGQIIPHIHFHIIPRKKDDNLKLWSQGKYPEGEAEVYSRKIKDAI